MSGVAPARAVTVTVDARWERGTGWSGPTALVATPDGFRPASGADPAPTRHLAGALLPGFRDAHVHLGLVDAVALSRGGLAAVDDLGGDPVALAALAARAARSVPRPGAPGLPEVRFAGAFLTAPGGYPSDRSWAPRGSVVEVADAGRAVAAVDRQVAAGASFVKVALHAGAGPVPDDATLRALVGRAHERGRPVVAHTEGAGQARRALVAGVDRLAHAPFSERLTDDLVAAMARGQTWVSTLDVHGWGEPTDQHAVALDNLTRFVAAGGTVVYGTDQGNGPLPAGIDARELRALLAVGLTQDALLRALTSGPATAALTHLPGPRPGPGASPEELAAWFAGARVLTPHDLHGRPRPTPPTHSEDLS
ncbi:amidohydrolase [Oerskovia sp. Sa1BUA8]|uniref:Amidohydrolase n=1 Tax=Oerskovia douganii TaxID=2762210 RepID=A0A9D5YZD6_9CELL|nr:amidohydrolase [Oerskovia douganii]MBE7700406.1 amidohydrolase [Oerskovia douganii]